MNPHGIWIPIMFMGVVCSIAFGCCFREMVRIMQKDVRYCTRSENRNVCLMAELILPVLGLPFLNPIINSGDWTITMLSLALNLAISGFIAYVSYSESRNTSFAYAHIMEHSHF